jgi:hypothetical protein
LHALKPSTRRWKILSAAPVEVGRGWIRKSRFAFSDEGSLIGLVEVGERLG